MPHPRSDPALRRAVTELARLHPEDLALILDALAPAERTRIDGLIADLGEPAVESGAEPVWTYEGVSPWLKARLDPDARPRGKATEFVLMTDAARGALATAAQPFRTARPPAGPGRSLVSRIWDRLMGTPA